MNKLKSIMLGLGIMSITLTSCGNDDDGPSYSARTMENTELKTILMQKGYSFNEQGALLLDDLAKNTTSLDLSGTGISDFSGLEIFPNLTDLDLSDNGYEMSFDFSRLPAQITGVDLTGNELYEFPGLLDIVTRENGDEDVTVLHALNKLYLPHSAKYNCDEIPTFFAQDVCPDMQMADANGTLEAYNTLREVPDEKWRGLLKKLYPSMFEGDKINIAKRLVLPNEKSQNITTIDYDARTMTVNDIEGFQYIVCNKGYNGAMMYLLTDEVTTIDYFPVPKSIFGLLLKNISTPNGMQTKNAENLCYIDMAYNTGIENLDLSSSKTFGQRGDNGGVNPEYGDFLSVCAAENLKSIVFPAGAKVADEITVLGSKNLTQLNLQQFEALDRLNLALLPNVTIQYPILKRVMFLRGTMFGIDEDIYNRQATKDFIQKYYVEEHLIKRGTIPSGYGAKGYNWTKNYK